MLGIFAAMILLAVVGAVIIYYGCRYEEPIAFMPGAALIVFGTVLAGVAWDNYRKYGSYPEMVKEKKRVIVHCECGSPIKCRDCLELETITDKKQANKKTTCNVID